MTSRLPDVTSDVNLPHVPPGVSTAAMRRPGSGGRLPPPSALIHVRRTPTAADKPTAHAAPSPTGPSLLQGRRAWRRKQASSESPAQRGRAGRTRLPMATAAVSHRQPGRWRLRAGTKPGPALGTAVRHMKVTGVDSARDAGAGAEPELLHRRRA